MTEAMSNGRGLGIAVLVIATFSGIWNAEVKHHLREPYLDEVFHVRQAQVYCSGDFKTWDPKITTPPGLYIVSYILYRLTGRCDIDFLRITNCATLCLIVLESYQLIPLVIDFLDFPQTHGPDHTAERVKSRNAWQIAHTAMNIALFPPIFFFSGLYYTDLESLFAVLVVAHLCLLQLQRKFSWVLLTAQLAFGLTSLLYRQTNVFWAGVFPSGLVLLKIYKTQASSQQSSKQGELGPHLEDFVFVALDLVTTAVVNVFTLVVNAVQHVFVIVAFAAFIVWNGGVVVLGDKSNHVATLHLPQMLYIWPCFFFFSFPVILLPHLSRLLNRTDAQHFPRIWILGIVTALLLLTVHYNTIIHPFTLADNRHYTFYVFKLLRKHWLIRYFAALVYPILGWITLSALLFQSTSVKKNSGEVKEKSTASLTKLRLTYTIIWTVTTSLNLVTAPLVEPRYFIVPWVFWRIAVVSTSEGNNQQRRAALWLETVWYCLINTTTCYLFLNRPFSWLQEPGKNQRFMW